MTAQGWEVAAILALILGAVGYLCRRAKLHPPGGDSKPNGERQRRGLTGAGDSARIIATKREVCFLEE